MNQQRCKHGKAMENPCWECDEERAERIAADVFNPAESDLQYLERRKRELAEKNNHATVDDKCPKCHGVPERPDIEGCDGCMACDFHGTRAGFDEMQRLDALARAASPTGSLYDDDDSHLT